MPTLRHAPFLPSLLLACLAAMTPWGVGAADPTALPATKPEAVIQSTTTRRLDVVEPPALPGLPPVTGTITATVHLIADPGPPDPESTAAPGISDRLKTDGAAGEETRLIFLSATVYGHSRTFLRWSPPGQPGSEFAAWSNLDFNHFSGPSSYPLLLGLCNETTAPPVIPALPDLAACGPAFAVVQGDPSNREAIRSIQDLHSLYRIQGEQMAAAFNAREAALQQRRAFLLTHPLTPKNVEILFWKTGPGAPTNQPPATTTARGFIQPLSETESGQEQLSISRSGVNSWNLTWQGVAGRTYFVQWSLDLVTWTYAPFIEDGDGAKSYGVSSTAPSMFFRLVHTDQVTADPKNDDFDGDRVSNRNEVLQGTDPLENADDDLDGMPSDWEVRFLLDPHDPLDAAADRDGDGISNLPEFTAGTDPTDYYNSEQPHFTLISGDQQYAEPDTFSTAPVVAELRVNGVPRANAPVRIEIYPSTPALISLSSDGSHLNSRIDATSGPDGRVAVFVKHGPAPAINYFDFSAGSEVTSRAFSIHTASAITQVRLIYPPGTLGRDAADAIDSRLAGQDPLAAKPVFSLQDHAAATYVRNTGCWAYDLRQQMTCISPWNSMDGARRAGVAITPRHLLNAAHFFLNPGTIIRFITADNAVIERTIVSRAIHPDYQPEPPYPDLAVYTLDSDLPPEITPCKMLPSDFAAALGPLGPYYPPALGLDQEENALVFDFGKISPPGSARSFATFYPPTLPAARSSYHEAVVTGDSGNPAFLILHDSLALLTVWSTGALGTFTTTHLAALNAMIAAADAQAGVSTGFQIQTVDLSGYLLFSP